MSTLSGAARDLGFWSNRLPPTPPRREAALPVPMLTSIRAYAAIARPDHWCKNVFMALGVVLAYFCHPEVFGAGTVVSIVWAVAATCLIASEQLRPQRRRFSTRRAIRAHPVTQQADSFGANPPPLAYLEWISPRSRGALDGRALNAPFFFSSLSLLVMGSWLL